MSNTTKTKTEADRKPFDEDVKRKVITRAEKVSQHQTGADKKLMRQLANVQRELKELASEKGKRTNKKGRGGRGKPVYPQSPKMQRAVVKITYAQNLSTINGSEGQWRQSGIYVEREGAEREGEKGKGYDQNGEVELSKTLDEWQKSNDPLMWKIIISPEFGEYTNIKETTIEMMKLVAADLGIKPEDLEWVAIDHYNTSHPHTHLFLRGVDKDGKELEITPDYIKKGFRQRTQEALTNQLGYRTERWNEIAVERQVQQDRFTAIDKQLLLNVERNNGIFVENIMDATNGKSQALAEIRRVQHLEKMGLAERLTATTFKLDDDLEAKLKGYGVLKDRTTILEKHRRYMSNPTLEFDQTNLRETGSFVSGKVLGAGLDPATENPYLLIEGVDGKAHYVAMNKKLMQERLNEKLPTGEMVIVEVKEFTPPNSSNAIKFVDAKAYGRPEKALEDIEYLSRTAEADNRGKITIIRVTDKLPTLKGTIADRVNSAIELKQIDRTKITRNKKPKQQEIEEESTIKATNKTQKSKGVDIA